MQNKIKVDGIKQFKKVERLLLDDGYYWQSNTYDDGSLHEDEAERAKGITVDEDKNFKQLFFSSFDYESETQYYRSVITYDEFLLSKGISGNNDKKVLVLVKGDKSKLQSIIDHFRSVSDLPYVKDHEILQIVLLNNEVKSIGPLSWWDPEKDPNIDFYTRDAVVEADDFIKNNIVEKVEVKKEEEMKKLIKLNASDFDFVNDLRNTVNDSPFTGYTFINELRCEVEKIEHLSEILDDIAHGELEELLINYIMGDGDGLELVRQELYIVRSANKDEDDDFSYLDNFGYSTYNRNDARKFTTRESANEKAGAFGFVETL